MPKVLTLNCQGLLFPDTGSLFKGIGQLQHAQVVLVPAYNLDSHRQPFNRETTGH